MAYETSISGIRLKSPIFNASGPLCSTLEELEAIGRSKSSAIMTKSCTLEGRKGNPEPRYRHIGNSSINSMGLPNLGYLSYMEMIPKLKTFGKPVVSSISGLSIDDNVTIVKAFGNTGTDMLELNLSCPNIAGKPQVGYDFEQMDSVLEEVMKVSGKPLGVKLPPYFDMAHFRQVAEILNRHKPSFVTCINSLGNGMFIDAEKEETLIRPNGGFGGIGGEHAKPTGLANVRKFYELLDKSIDVIGVGGISSGKDVFEYVLAGAKAVQLASVFMHEGEGCFERIESEFSEFARRKGYDSIEDFRGKLKIV